MALQGDAALKKWLQSGLLALVSASGEGAGSELGLRDSFGLQGPSQCCFDTSKLANRPNARAANQTKHRCCQPLTKLVSKMCQTRGIQIMPTAKSSDHKTCQKVPAGAITTCQSVSNENASWQHCQGLRPDQSCPRPGRDQSKPPHWRTWWLSQHSSSTTSSMVNHLVNALNSFVQTDLIAAPRIFSSTAIEGSSPAFSAFFPSSCTGLFNSSGPIWAPSLAIGLVPKIPPSTALLICKSVVVLLTIKVCHRRATEIDGAASIIPCSVEREKVFETSTSPNPMEMNHPES